MEDSSVQFASSSYGAGSSYGASPQYTQVTPFLIFFNQVSSLPPFQVKQEPDFNAGPGLALSGGHAIALSPRSHHPLHSSSLF